MNYLSKVFGDFTKVKIESWVFVLALVAASFLLSKVLRAKRKFDTKRLTIGSLCIALSFILSYIRFYHMPQGGSITPGSMLPLILYAFIFGPVDGILAGMVYGILQFIQDPFIVHWMQVLLDYPLAFGALGLAGYIKNNFTLSIITAGIGRLFFHFLSGVIFFANYAVEANMNVFLYSFIYNGTIVGIEIAVCVVISLIPQFNNAILKLKEQYK